MGLAPLRILILEDVPMDAELVEYELERARIPFAARRVDTRESFLREIDEFAARLILSDYTLPRSTAWPPSPSPGSARPAVPFLIVTGSVNEETAVGCMKAGATDYLLKSNLARIGPAIEGALARVRARNEKARAEEALRRSEANLRAIFNNSLQAFVLIDPDGTIKALNSTAVEWSARLLGRALREGAPVTRLPSRSRGRASARRWPGESRTVERCLRDTDGAERWFETTHAPVVDEEGAVIGVCLNARDVSDPEAGRAGAARERGALSRPLRQRERSGLRHRRRGRLPLRQSRVAAAIGHLRDRAAPAQLPDMLHPDSRDRYERGGRPGAGGRNAHPRRAGPGDQPAAPRSPSRAISAAPPGRPAAGCCAGSTAT